MTYDNLEPDLSRIIATALAEDMGAGDITSELTISEKIQGQMTFIVRQPMLVCGSFVPQAVFAQLDTAVQVTVTSPEGTAVEKETILACAKGKARVLLTGERVALNIMQRMSGIATLTKRYVDAVSGTKAVILDTRKTMPGLRLLDKYAVRVGGGQNHRFGLYDMVLIKDNHIAACGSISEAIRKARAGTSLSIEVECDTLEQFREALAAKPDRILLDNMDLKTMRVAVKEAAGKLPLEASGGVSFESVRAIAETGVDYISVGKLTHSVPAADIAGELV